MNRPILLVDDEKNITLVLKTMLEKSGFAVASYNDPLLAVKSLETQSYGAVITDLQMPRMSGLELLEHVHQVDAHLPVIMITAYGTVESAVQALKQGAFDYITKPFEKEELVHVLQKAVNTYNLHSLEPKSPEPQVMQSMMQIGASEQMQEVARMVSKIASSPTTVLISGESGTGKELVATAIHRASDRASKPFVKINCAAIPHNLIESELFGYEKGAFTGALNSKPGRFELAHEGTLFLDEVAEMPLEMQVKLLRAIQESEFERVGGLATIKVNVRLIAATNKDLAQEVKEGRFREDLYYRLNVVPLFLPPLRERSGDVPILISYFLKKFNEKLHKSVETVSPECLGRLSHYYWPGNIRQLENVLEHAVLMCESSEIQTRDLPKELAALWEEEPFVEVEKNPVEEFEGGEKFKDIVRRRTQVLERELISKVLAEHEGNVTKSAEKLGLSRKGLQLKLKELGLKTDAFFPEK